MCWDTEIDKEIDNDESGEVEADHSNDDVGEN